jgi:hypothetical protein
MMDGHWSSQQVRLEDAVLDAGTGPMAPGVWQALSEHGVWHLAEVGTASMMQVRFTEHVTSTLAAWTALPACAAARAPSPPSPCSRRPPGSVLSPPPHALACNAATGDLTASSTALIAELCQHKWIHSVRRIPRLLVAASTRCREHGCHNVVPTQRTWDNVRRVNLHRCRALLFIH